MPALELAGGADGKPSNVEICRADGEILHVLKGDHELRVGDQVVIRTGGGGGYGPPEEPDPQKVLKDVEASYVSLWSARDDYFVAITGDGRIDAEATGELRKQQAPTS